jgi:hypothetical protein
VTGEFLRSDRTFPLMARTKTQKRSLTPLRRRARYEVADLAAVQWLRAHSRLVFILLVSIGSFRIVTTYDVFSETSDEPAHMGCGMEWLAKGSYKYEPQHPPLARVATALGPYLAGVRSYNTPEMWAEGMAVLNSGGRHDRNLTLGRLGILPFFWFACWVMHLWGKRYLGEPGTTLGVLFFSFLPSILAHAGLATTDLALTATVGAAFLAALTWVDRPTWWNCLVFGAATALSVLSKFSALVFIPASLAAALIWYFATERPGFSTTCRKALKLALPFCAAVSAGFFVIWAGYRFSVGHVPFTSLRVPAPEISAGIREVLEHNRTGHYSYLLGEQRRYGWWYYYLVVLAVKTPLPFLGLLLCGLILRKTQNTDEHDIKRGVGLALAFSLGILTVASFSNINIGVRHILPVYMGFSIIAAVGVVRLLERCGKSKLAGWVLAFSLFWLVGTSILTHPDYLPYFNALAGSSPEQILVDSDFDWGQDMKRLAHRLREVGAKEVAFYKFFHCDLPALGFPPVRDLNPVEPTAGWSAANVTVLKSERFGLLDTRKDLRFWPNEIKPTEKVGKGIWLWYFPPDAVPKDW